MAIFRPFYIIYYIKKIRLASAQIEHQEVDCKSNCPFFFMDPLLLMPQTPE